jgi:DNA primase
LIIFDNDETGLSSASKFRDKGFNTFAIPETFRARFGIKDPSDFVKIYGLEAFKELLKKENLL